MQPMTRSQWLNMAPLGSHSAEKENETIRQNAQWLIEHLYIPVVTGYRLSPTCPENIAKEPVNWGDLSAVDVVPHDTGWMITLEEAAPGACPNLCEYVRSWLETWGWQPIVVVSEW